MTELELLELLGNVKDSYVAEAHTPVQKVRTFRRPLLIAAMITLALLLVGCTVAYVNGWFTDFFAARSEEPLSPQQIEYIQENERRSGGYGGYGELYMVGENRTRFCSVELVSYEYSDHYKMMEIFG